MPKKLTKDQKSTVRRSLCVRISTETAERLATMANDAGIHQWQMATRIIHYGIPGFGKFEWASSSLNPQPIKYKGVTGDKQLNLRITSTAWNKLACYVNKYKQSKARVFQQLVQCYKPLTREQRLEAEQKRREQQEYYAEWNGVGMNIPEFRYHKRHNFLVSG